jgi:cell division protease FtsH
VRNPVFSAILPLLFMKNTQKDNRVPPLSKLPKLPKGKSATSFVSTILWILFGFFVVIQLYSFLSGRTKNPTQEITLSELASSTIAGMVQSITVEESDLTIVQVSGTTTVTTTAKKEKDASLTDTLRNYGVTSEALAKVNITIKEPSGVWGFLGGAFNIFLIAILPLIIIMWFLSRQVKGAGMQAFTFGQTKARIIEPTDENQRVVFADIAGNKEAKQELQEVVDFLKNPKKFLDIGAKIPKGVMLTGAPGTGKTLMARAVAGEARVPFFHLSGSEFVEMFVGVGASRVRDLFALAKEKSPAIIFIDEIDAVGRVRGSGTGGGNDEREQTLNQILVEMDGFEPSEKVIVIAATNRPDVLDPALLRPGRFDRRVTIDLPDRADRLAILQVHARKKPFAEDVNLNVIAERTPGFSGADLASLMNEAAILAAREDRKTIGQFDVVRSIEKVMLGPERKSHVLSVEEKKKTAYHEAGHALLASVLEYADPVHKVSIIARGSAGGYTLKLPIEEKRLPTKKEFLDDIVVALGGYVAEEMMYGDISTGPSNDLQVSTALARDMVTKYGMSEKFGPVALEGAGGRATYGRGINDREYSEKVGSEIDAEVGKIMNEAKKRAFETMTTHKKLLEDITKTLTEKETLEQDEFNEVLIRNGIAPKKKKEEIL